ncbi:MAG: DUF3090 family protein [Chloroflexi bacterium]|nr:DUF3090 family protein [Chloroflexota bacterium]
MTIELGVARGIDAQAFGEPGQRTFRLRLLGATSESVCLWVEKEHLRALGMAIQQVLAQLKYGDEPPAADAGQFPEPSQQEFRIGLMAVGFSQPDRTLVLQVSELGVGEEEEPTLRVQLTLDHCASLAAQLDEIIAGGRPVCSLCGLSIDPSGHACIRSNGHSDQPVPDAGDEPDASP